MLEQLKPGESVVIPGRGGWEMKITACEGGGFDFTHRNPVSGDQYKFFIYDTTGNPYGAGMVVQEPTLGVPAKDCGVDVEGTIIGAIVLGEDGNVTDRFSWSNLVFVGKGTFSIDSQGRLAVDGVEKGYLQAVFLADKNRIKGYVGVFGPNPKKVKILEMETLLSSISIS